MTGFAKASALGWGMEEVSVLVAETQFSPPLVSVAGKDPRECVCHRCHPGHTDELHSLCLFLGHHCPESWIQTFL